MANGQELDRGQFEFGEEEIARVTGLTRTNVRTLNRHLTRMGELVIVASKRGSIGSWVRTDHFILDKARFTEAQSSQGANGQASAEGDLNAGPVPARQRDVYLDTVQALWNEFWPNLDCPARSLLCKWRTHYGEEPATEMVQEVGLRGKGFDTTQAATAYLSKALQNRAKDSRRSGFGGEKAHVITNALGEPITDAAERLDRIRRSGYVSDPDQGYSFTLADEDIAARRPESATPPAKPQLDLDLKESEHKHDK